MPSQTTKTSSVFFPDGCLVEIDDGSGYFDLGALSSDVTNTLEWQENKVETANAGPLNVQIRQMQMSGSFTLINLDPEGVEKLGGGLFTLENVTGAVTPEDQVQSDPAAEVLHDLVMLDSSGNNLRTTSAPSITSVTGASSGVLTVNTDYDVIANTASVSGYSIRYETGAVTGSEDVTIVYPSNTVITSEILYMGTSTAILTAYGIRLTHTDDNSKIRQLELYSVDTGSGGIQFNFKGANADGTEEMPISYVAKVTSSKIDGTTLVDGRQLAAWTIDDGAE